MSIHKKLLEFQKLGITLVKDGSNPHFHSSYATLNEVLDKVKEPLNKMGIVIIQESGVTGLKTKLWDTEDDTWVESLVPYTETSTAQKLGSNITYIRRYALVALLGLGDEDDDGNKASEPRPKPYAAPQRTEMPKSTQSLYKHVTVPELKMIDKLDPRVPQITEDEPLNDDPFKRICSCGQLKVRKQSKSVQNPGRWYWTCPKKSYNDQCKGAFEWEEEGDSRQDNIEGEKLIDYSPTTGELLP